MNEREDVGVWGLDVCESIVKSTFLPCMMDLYSDFDIDTIDALLPVARWTELDLSGMKTDGSLNIVHYGEWIDSTMGVEGAKRMRDLLMNDSTVTVLNLRCRVFLVWRQQQKGNVWTVTRVGDEGAKKISKLLLTNTTLTKLDLSCERSKKEGKKWIVWENSWAVNGIGIEGATKISESLMINSTLAILRLNCILNSHWKSKRITDNEKATSWELKEQRRWANC